jgi:uncharacterized protein
MKDKISKYNVEMEHTDCMFLYNTLSNALLAISYEEYAVVETLLEHPTIFNDKYPALYQKMKNSGFIIDRDFDEFAYIKLQNKRRIYANSNYHLTINPTLDCNLKCWYCSVDYAGTKHDKGRMSNKTIEQLNKHIEHLVEKEGAKSLLLDWFGGEPTMYYEEVMRKVSDHACRLIKGTTTRFFQHITTNATLLSEERIMEMKEANFSFFQISTDGNEHSHNRVKHFSDKQGTYKKVMENVNLIAELIPEASICLRINYDTQTLKHITDIIPDLSEQCKRSIIVDFQRVWQVSCTEEIKTSLLKAKESFKEAGFKSSHWAYHPQRYQCCYADSLHHYVVNYDGRIFKCTARDYSDQQCIGELKTSSMISWNDNILK